MSRTQKLLDEINQHLAQSCRLFNELGELSYEEREFGEGIEQQLDCIRRALYTIEIQIISERHVNGVEMGLRFNNRTRFYCSPEGEMNRSLSYYVGDAWLEPEDAFAERDKREKSNQVWVERRKATPRKFAVYGYSPVTGCFKKYETIEDAKKDRIKY